MSSNNVELVSHVPGHLIGGHFQKRNTPSGKKTYFFATGVQGVQVFDASDPKIPVQVGALTHFHWENEDVDLAGDTLLVSGDGSTLTVVDVSDPSSPRVRGSLRWQNDPNTWGNSRPGHIANCIAECSYAWVGGGRGGRGWIAVVDLTQQQPKMVSVFQAPAGDPNAVFKKGTIHDVNVDPSGLVWLTGSGGVSAYGVGGRWGGTPTEPRHITSHDASGLNTFILHNSLRPNAGPYLYVAEENWLHDDADCEAQGRFEVWTFDGASVTPVSQWALTPKRGRYADGSSAMGLLCSAHWFDYRNDGVVATSWYQQGVRFLDVNDPNKPKEIGYWLAPDAAAWASYFHPDDSSIVYVADVARGLDVIRKCPGACSLGGGVGLSSPFSSSTTVTFSASQSWGLACPAVEIKERIIVTGAPTRR